jgi:RHS repeat-associated protein
LVGVIDAAVGTTGALDDSAANVYNVHSGLLGEPLRMSDSGRAVVWAGDHDPFGNRELPPSNTATLNAGLPGQYQDSETGNSKNWHRDYLAPLGRYAEPDPTLVYSNPNVSSFAYTDGNPQTGIDPTGDFRISPGMQAQCPNWNAALSIAKEASGCYGPSKTCSACGAAIAACLPPGGTCDLCHYLDDKSGYWVFGWYPPGGNNGYTVVGAGLVWFALGLCTGDPGQLATTMLHEALHECSGGTIGDDGPKGKRCDAEDIATICRQGK